MTEPEVASSKSPRTPMTAGERRWFAIWVAVAGIAALAMFLSRYHFPHYEWTLREMPLGQLPSSLDFSLKLARMICAYFAVLFGIHAGLVALAYFCRLKWVIPIVAVLPLLSLAAIQVMLSTGMKEAEALVNAYDLAVVDRWLAAKDSFLEKQVSGEKVFERRSSEDPSKNLARALYKRDPAAPARFVLMGILDSDHPNNVRREEADAFCTMVGMKLPFARVPGRPMEEFYIPAHLYFWWQENKGKYPSFPLLDEWLDRDSTKKERIPEFQKARAAYNASKAKGVR